LVALNREYCPTFFCDLPNWVEQKTGVSSAEGELSLENMTPGSWDLSVSDSADWTPVHEYYPVTLNPGQSLTMTIEVQPRP
jgi:hypothetical protein